jgi:hypothetical protein
MRFVVGHGAGYDACRFCQRPRDRRDKAKATKKQDALSDATEAFEQTVLLEINATKRLPISVRFTPMLCDSESERIPETW